MATATILMILTGAALGEITPQAEVEKQNLIYQHFWGTDFVWKFDELPLKGGVPNERIPYSGYIYPDNQGGTVHSLRKYDVAFNGGRTVAADHERWDTTAFKETKPGLLGSLFKVKETPAWYGHCNGWTSAAIRHAEPVHSVTKNGVTFTPSDIKGLLAELYTSSEHVVLAGENEAPIGAASLHALIANWLGRGSHALGIEAEPGEEKWNYPAYAFAASAAKRSAREVEVTMNVVHAADSRVEWDESPRLKEVKYFHYLLDLDDEGRIVGGRFFSDSSAIDMLWVPLRPKAPGTAGNEDGNPYINVETILSLWRESVPSDTRATWLNIDPTEIIDRDRVQLPVADVVVAVREDSESAEIEVPRRVVPRSFMTPTSMTSQSMTSRRGDCYHAERERAAQNFEALLHGHAMEASRVTNDESQMR